MEVKVQLNHLHIAPRKVRLVANLIKGREIKGAKLELRHLPKRSALPLLKLMESAVANAKHNFDLREDSLRIKNVVVDQGPTLKRYRPRAFGKAALIRKESSHISLILETTEKNDSMALSSPRKKNKSEPILREMKLEDLKNGVALKEKIVSGEKKEIRPRIKSVDFVRRMFRRKTI